MSKNFFSFSLFLILLTVLFGTKNAPGQEKSVFRVGIIGTTTSHVPAVLNLMNGSDPKFKDPKNAGIFKQFRVTGVYKGGMPDNESSWSRRDKYAAECEKLGAKVYLTIEELVQNVDGVLLESVDGRPHLEQAKPVIAARKPMFIDKPAAGSLADALEIFRLAAENKTPVFSTSSLRYVKGFQKMRNDKPAGKVLGCDAYSPAHLNEKHPDIYWYGIHGVESLFTIMGVGCLSVSPIFTILLLGSGRMVGLEHSAVFALVEADTPQKSIVRKELKKPDLMKGMNQCSPMSADSLKREKHRSILRKRSKFWRSCPPRTKAGNREGLIFRLKKHLKKPNRKNGSPSTWIWPKTDPVPGTEKRFLWIKSPQQSPN